MIASSIRRVLTAGAVLTAAMVPAHSAQAATISPSVFTDDATGNGNCTLREAIIAANTDTATDACPAGAGPDTVALGPGTYP